MKRSDKPTNYILVRAENNSDWDCVTFALIHVTHEWKKKVKETSEFIKKFQSNHNYNFAHLSLYQNNIQFFSDEIVDDILDADDEWCWVELDVKELSNFETPEQSIDSEMLKFNGNGYIYYTAYGKRTSEEFWTLKIKVDKPLK